MTTSVAPGRDQALRAADTAKGSRLSAATYEPFLWWAERRGMQDLRRALVSQAHGRVLEVGAGTGLNVAHYPADLDRLVLAEPEPHMARRLTRRAEAAHVDAEVVRAPAEVLPFPDDSFDTVVCTLVLCTVPDQESALLEIRRVLRSGGSLLFLEHVRSDDPRHARWQDRLEGPWAAFADGCRCNRRTVDAVRTAGFTLTDASPAVWRGMPGLVRPLVSGRARA